MGRAPAPERIGVIELALVLGTPNQRTGTVYGGGSAADDAGVAYAGQSGPDVPDGPRPTRSVAASAPDR